MTKAVFPLLSTVLSAPVLLLLFVGPLTGSPLQQDEQASLLAAVAEEQPDLVRRLLEQGADPDSRGPDGMPVLMAATQKGRGEIVEILLAHGADPNAQEARYGGTALMLAAESGNLEIVRALLDVGADVNARAEEGVTALILTMESGSLEVFRLLLEYGADANAPYWSVSGENDGPTFLMVVAAGGLTLWVEALLEHGADVTAEDAHRRTALFYAVEHCGSEGATECHEGHDEVAEILRNLGAPEMVSRDPTAQPSYTLPELAGLAARSRRVRRRMDEVPTPPYGQPEAEGRRDWEIARTLIFQTEEWDTRLEWLATAYYLSSLASEENTETAWYVYHIATRPVFDWMSEQLKELDCGRSDEAPAAVRDAVDEFCAVTKESRRLLRPVLEEMD